MALGRLLYAEDAGAIYTASDMRNVNALIAKLGGGPNLALFGGGASIGFVSEPTDFAITPGGASGFAVTIAAGTAIIATDATATEFHVAAEESTTVVTGFVAADPSLATVDLICIHARDNDLDSSGFNNPAYFIVQGSPGLGPPGDPGGQYIVLYEATRRAAAMTFLSGDLVSRMVPIMVAQPFHFETLGYTPGGNQDTAGGNPTWPTGLTKTITIPAWATTARLYAKIGQVAAVTNSPVDVGVSIQLGSIVADAQRIRWNATEVDGGAAQDITLAATVDVTAIAGQTGVVLRTVGNNAGSGDLRVSSESICYLEAMFY